jgi:hypothetical protein
MYVFLCFEAQRNSRTALLLTNNDFQQRAGMSPNSVHDGRVQLEEFGLVKCMKGSGGVFTYQLCNPATGAAIPDSRGAPKDTKPSGAATEIRSHSRPASLNAATKRFTDSLSPQEFATYFEKRLDAPAGSRRGHGHGYMMRCPLHDDREPSLHVTPASGVWNCFGCGAGGGIIDLEVALHRCTRGDAVKRITELLGRPELLRDFTRSRAEDIYTYHDEHWNALFEVVRLAGKRFMQRHHDSTGAKWINNIEGVRRVLYRLPEVIAASRILLCEGEKDADNGRRAFAKYAPLFAATTNPGGAGNWRDELADCLEGKSVVTVPDNDASGERWAEAVADSLRKRNIKFKIVKLPVDEHGDLSDYLEKHGAEKLWKLIAGVPWVNK